MKDSNKRLLVPLIAVLAVLAIGFAALATSGANAAAESANVTGNVTSGFKWSNQTWRNSSYARYNLTGLERQEAALAQCKTTFVDSAAPIVSDALKISINTTAVDSANARLQANVTGKANMSIIMANFRSFSSAMSSAYWQAVGGARGLNQTQLAALKADISTPYQSLISCTSSNQTLTAGSVLRGFSISMGRYASGWMMRGRWGGGFHFHGR